jgi:hypothetical protein
VAHEPLFGALLQPDQLLAHHEEVPVRGPCEGVPVRGSLKARAWGTHFRERRRYCGGEARHEPASIGAGRLDDIADGEPTEDTP